MDAWAREMFEPQSATWAKMATEDDDDDKDDHDRENFKD